MLTEISIENFKAFAKRQCIPLKPITLLYGPNSAGKSSLLQALLMLKQTAERNETGGGALLPEGEYVDLGGYKDFINNHNKGKEFKFGISIKFSDYMDYIHNNIFSPGYPIFFDSLSIQFTFFQDVTDEILLKAINIFQHLISEPLAEYKNVWFNSKLRKAIQDKIETEKLTGKDLSAWKSTLKKSVLVLESMNFKDETLIRELDDKINFFNGDEKDVFSEDIDFILKKIEDINSKTEPTQKDDKIYLKGIQWIKALEFVEILNECYNSRSYNKLFKIKTPPFDRLISLSNCFPRERLRGDEELFKDIDEFKILGSLNFSLSDTCNMPHASSVLSLPIFFLSKVLPFYLQNVVYVGPLRALPKRVYEFSGGGVVSDVGTSGENTPHILYQQQNVVDKVNEWFKRVKIGYETEVARIKGDIFKIEMKDKKTGWKASPKDVGFGVSQLLPILVQGIISKNKIICIEQPEIHIHPRLQAELGSFIASNIKPQFNKSEDYIKEEPGNQFIIETHSEHLILRLLRLIRKTTNGELEEGDSPLCPEDVAVIYAEPTEQGTKLMELRISDDGDFIDRWPNGFFTERAEELFE